MKQKTCPKCKLSFDESVFFTLKNKKKKPYCPDCTRQDKRERYAKDPTYAKTSAKAWAATNAERYKANQERYRKENRAALNALAKEYRVWNAEAIRESAKLRGYDAAKAKRAYEKSKLRRALDPEFDQHRTLQQRRCSRKWYRKHRSEILHKAKLEREANPQLYLDRSKKSNIKWRKSHPERAAEIRRIRYAMRKGAKYDGFKEAPHRAHLELWQGNRCFHCLSSLGRNHLDHYVPIVKNGIHSASNLVLSCPYCNISKNGTLVGLEWEPTIKTTLNVFYEDSEFEKLVGVGSKFKLLSTFACREFTAINAKTIVEEITADGQIPFFDFEWQNRKTAITHFINDKCGRSSKIGARKTKLVELDTDDARDFLEEYHIQGFGAGMLYLGLVHEDALVGVTSWAFKNDTFELNRMAFRGRVVGGFSKMLNGLLQHPDYAGQPIFSFVDPRYATGDSYEKVGFKYVGDTAHQSYYYVNSTGLFPRRNFMKSKMASFLTYFNVGLTEVQNARANGFFRIFGLCQRKYLYTP